MGSVIFFLILFFIIIPRIQQSRSGKYVVTDAQRAAEKRRAQEAARRAEENRQAMEEASRRTVQGASQAARGAVPRYAAPPNAAQRQSAPQYEAPRRAAQRQAAPPQPAEAESPAKRKQRLGLLGGIAAAAGATMFGVGFFGSLSELIWYAANGLSFSSELALSLFSALSAAACAFGAYRGFRLRGRAKRYELYQTIIGTRRVCPVADIARASGRKPEQVLRELFEMVCEGYFPLGFVDEETACFYADNDAYRQANPERARAQDEQLRAGAQADAHKEPAQEQPAEGAGRAVGEEDLRELKRRLAGVENEEVRSRAARLCEHAEDIFAWVRLHPECAEDVRRFSSYYLPTANKLLGTYSEVAAHTGESSVAAGIESEVVRVLDTMTTAFRGLMDNLLQNTAVDLQAEISALETVMAQEGLTKDGLSEGITLR